MRRLELGEPGPAADGRPGFELDDVSLVERVDESGDRERVAAQGLVRLRILAEANAGESGLSVTARLLAGHGAVLAEDQAFLVDAAPAGERTVFDDEGLGPGRRDFDAEAFGRVVEDDIGPLARGERVDRAFADSDGSRHPVATEKETKGNDRQCNIRLGRGKSSNWVKLSNERKYEKPLAV
jgi:hypothetical protein